MAKLATITPIHEARLTGPMAWVGRELKGVDEFAFQILSRHARALREILQRTRQLERSSIERKDCSHPDLDADLSAVLDQVQNGTGVVLLRGLPIDGLQVEEIERIFWILGTHMGPALSQYSFGDTLVRVQEEKPKAGDQSSRGSKASQELAMHTDFCEVMGLMCVRAAPVGGESHLCSILAVHNEIWQTRPDVLPILYRGFPFHRRGEQPGDQDPVTPYPVPVLANVDGYISTMFLRGHALAGLAELGREPTAGELEALNVFRDVALRQKVSFRMAPGEALVINNYAVLHSRSEYCNAPEPAPQRLMLRLWLEAGRDRRPVVPELIVYRNKGGRNGVDAVPGRTMARTDYQNVSEKSLQVLRAERS